MSISNVLHELDQENTCLLTLPDLEGFLRVLKVDIEVDRRFDKLMSNSVDTSSRLITIAQTSPPFIRAVNASARVTLSILIPFTYRQDIGIN